MDVSLLLALGVVVALGLIWIFCHHQRSPAAPETYTIKNAKVCPKCSARQDGKANRCGVCGYWF
jgi:ribosomal protein L40E